MAYRLQKRGTLLIEALTAIRLLRGGRYTVEELAAQLGKHRRATERLLYAIRNAGVPIRRKREGSWVYWSVDRDTVMEAFGLGGGVKASKPAPRVTREQPSATSRGTAYDALERWRKSEGL
jgi:DNA-binding transcriptional ArsR family regulator